MRSYEESVREFHQKYGHLISPSPNPDIPANVVDLRKKLIMEELQELMLAWAENDLIGMADGFADLIYVIVGTCISYGIPIDRVFTEVHRSNMTKTPSKAYEGQKYGEVNPKGPGYHPPEISKILLNPELPTNLEGATSDFTWTLPYHTQKKPATS